MGRILRAVLWHFQQDVFRATRIASMLGTAFGFLLTASGVLSLITTNLVGGFWQILIGFFVVSASRGSYSQLVIKVSLRDRTVRALMTANPVTADVGMNVQALVDDILLPRHVSFVPVMEGERLLGYVDAALVNGVDPESRATTPLGDILAPSDSSNTVASNVPTDALFEKMARNGQRKWLVADNGRLEGVISLSDLLSYLAIRQGLGIPPDSGN